MSVVEGLVGFFGVFDFGEYIEVVLDVVVEGVEV